MRQEGEASVEEILDSIKKVIARDNRTGAMDVRRRRETEAEKLAESADIEEAEEVLELDTEAVVEDSSFEDEPLIGQASRDAMRDNLAALSMLAEPGAKPQIVRSGETSLEGMVREMLRPMLAQWLDTNLPPMVEQMVRDEIARVAGKRS